ncbi:hypothetical protein BO71DRAFT_483742 [Aspergillus ellipticus CBS 707.79]|uniref:Uncharacterized protein n=1 Tax=Aspergillus ellipticus CBS 707.79 TaxID=1448320 RepID=A0A319E1M3_9EURO|nr:hypothetical protein BO71DRAFT_483742 [Aspergillus ellipticus CBS 707.79]
MAPRRFSRRAISHEAWEKIQNTSRKNIRSQRQTHSDICKAVNSRRTIEKNEKFQKRLREVRARCARNGDNAVRLCCIGLTKSQVIDMNKDQWSLLLNKLEIERDGPILNPNSLCDMRYKHASLDGIAAIFDGRLCENIKKVRISEQYTWTAAVTMIFPQWNERPCTLIIDLAKGADELAMALFETAFTQSGQVQHIMTRGGPKLILPVIEFTLKGAKRKSIARVFGPKLSAAIVDGFNPEGSLEEESTENVAMTIKGEGAIFEIFLDPLRAVELAKKLYI